MSEACAWANAASRRISEKQGMRQVGLTEKDYVSGRMASEIWEITAEEWRAWKAREGCTLESNVPSLE